MNIDALRSEWKSLTSYERFEQIISRIIMLFISVVIVYSLCLAAIELVKDATLGVAFMGPELLQDIFGSLLTVLILLEFNHSIASALHKRSGILQARVVVLIAIIVIARKIILLDFKTATLEQFGAIAGMALALGLLYWLLGAENARFRPSIKPSTKPE